MHRARRWDYGKVAHAFWPPFAIWVVFVSAFAVFVGQSAATAVVWVLVGPAAVLAVIGLVYAVRLFWTTTDSALSRGVVLAMLLLLPFLVASVISRLF